MDTPARQERLVKCPGCGGPSLYAQENRFRPFCSQRCKNLDLGAWAAEQFRMPADAAPDDQPFGDPKLER